MTSNIEARLQSHNELGKSGWTKNYRPWIIAYQEQYLDKSETGVDLLPPGSEFEIKIILEDSQSSKNIFLVSKARRNVFLIFK